MCDTLLALPSATTQNIMLFGKNSDRQRNEAQALEFFPTSDHASGAVVATTYLTIPQAAHTHAVLLCRPFWMWGAEMGANEHGVVVGNEALQARSDPPAEPALTGMDLVRLALERAASAREALEVIQSLLNQHGQGGNCGHLTPTFYNNGFVIADSREAFVLETVEREWLVERARGVRSLSNVYSIGREPDRISSGLNALVRDSGWSAELAPHYADVIKNPDREPVSRGGGRYARSTALLQSLGAPLSARHMLRILRDHGVGPQSQLQEPANLDAITLCMHAGTADRPSQTVGSLVSELHPRAAVHWVTATSAPCISIFKPVFLDAAMPRHGSRPAARFDPESLWWRHEHLYRQALRRDFNGFLTSLRCERDALEEQFRKRVEAVRTSGTAEERSRVVAECWSEAMQMEVRWSERLGRMPAQSMGVELTDWIRLSRLAELEVQ